MKRNLPVKLFEKRKEIDERLVEGGGGGDLPKWVLKGEALKSRAQDFMEVLSSVEEVFEKRSESRRFIPVVVKAELNTEAIAKTHRKEIAKLFKTTNEESGLIGFTENKELLIKLNNRKALEEVEEKLLHYDRNSQGISSINYLESFSPCIVLPEKINSSLKIKLINYDDYEMNKSVGNSFERLLQSNERLRFKKTQYAENLVVYKVVLESLDDVEEIKDFEGLFSIEPMPSYSITMDFLDDEEAVSVKQPVDGIDYPVVGVLDSGIENIPQLSPWIINKKFASYPENVMDKSHGTFVAGVMLYGDELQGKMYTGLNGCQLFDATVFPDTTKETIEQDELIENIREAIKNNHERIKIWNMSLGTKDEADLASFSDFGVALDSIQDEYGVLICKSAGNCTNFINGAPKSRISKSADSVRSIVVGSIAHEKGPHDLADVNNPSPFSRSGRGPSHIIKPDLVHYGGNAGVYNGRLIQNGVKSFSKNGGIIRQSGTSFSTPRVTSIVAGVDHSLNEEFNPLLLKGLLIHSANYPEEIKLPIAEKINQVGFGLPKSINDILYNTPDEVTLIIQDTLDKGSYIDILDFPFPENMVEDGYFYGEIFVTVVYNPILDPYQGAEYCQSDIEVALGTYDSRKRRDTSKPTIRNPIGKEGNMNILNQGCYSKTALKQSTNFGLKERLLIQYSNKFYPVKKYAVNLEDMTETNKENFLKHPKQWFLEIKGLYRDFSENKALREGMELSQDFCVLITIRDPKHKNAVYDKATELLNRNNFIHSNVKVRNDVQVAVDRLDIE